MSANAGRYYLRLLDFTPQTPRPRHAKGGQPRGADGFQKNLATKAAAVAEEHPGAVVGGVGNG